MATADEGMPAPDVGAAYDRAAAGWRSTRPETLPAPLARLLDRALAGVAPGGRVLDVGCGAGVPVARALGERGYAMTGLDLSARLLDLARREVPAAAFVRGDMRAAALADLGGVAFDALVAWDSVFHVPRAEHAAVFGRFAAWLRPGGRLLVSLGGSAWEGTSAMLGETFFYSGHAPEESLRLLAAAGLAVRHAAVDDPSSRGHLAVIAERVGGATH